MITIHGWFILLLVLGFWYILLRKYPKTNESGLKGLIIMICTLISIPTLYLILVELGHLFRFLNEHITVNWDK
jgi:hypothetical protein